MTSDILHLDADAESVRMISRQPGSIMRWHAHVPTMTMETRAEDPTRPGAPPTIIVQAALRIAENGGWQWMPTWDSYYRMTAMVNQNLGSWWKRLADGDRLQAVSAKLSAGPQWSYFNGHDEAEAEFVRLLYRVYIALHPIPAALICPKCFHSQDLDATFCKKCGARVAAPPAVTAPVEALAPEVIPPTVPISAQQPARTGVEIVRLRACPSCGKKNRGDVGRCTHCAAAMA